MRLHTPSSYPRLRKCLGSAVLPWAVEEYEGTERGSALHAVPEAIISGATREEALAQVPQRWRAQAEELDTRPFELLRGRAQAEVGLAWNPDAGTCRMLGERMTRELARAASRPGEVPMVVDVLGLGEEVFIIDWKHGRGEQLAPAPEHWQLLTYGAVAMLAAGATRARCYLATWRGLRWLWEEVELDALDARAHLEQVRARLNEARAAAARFQATGEVPELARGPWCEWCPSQRYCPAGVAQLLALAREQAGLAMAPQVLELSPTEAGALYERLLGLSKLLERALADLRLLARQSPLLLPSGKEYVPRDRPRLQPEAAWAALAKTYGQELADKAIPLQRHGSMASVREAARELLKPAREALAAQGRIAPGRASLRALDEEVRGLLEAWGALEVNRSTQPEPGEPGGDEG